MNDPRSARDVPAVTAVNTDSEQGSQYAILRHLFDSAVESSLSDRRWVIYGTYSEPGRTMLTEYQHAHTGDRVKCQSFDYGRLSEAHVHVYPGRVMSNEAKPSQREVLRAIVDALDGRASLAERAAEGARQHRHVFGVPEAISGLNKEAESYREAITLIRSMAGHLMEES